jgi:redox-sensitive bicupin YhaK (pirin superfamily)
MRKIKLIKSGVEAIDGAGVHLYRIFGYHDTPLFDPFLLLDDFRNDKPENYIAGFPWHPHRGIETITYMLEGYAEHGDSLGNSGVIRKSEVQWMTAGSGIIHQEMPKPDVQGRMYGFQLWANLPATHKMIAPRYRDVSADLMPTVNDPQGASVKVICGSYLQCKGAVEDIVIDPQYWDVAIQPEKRVILPVKPGYTCFVYCYGGDAVIDSHAIYNRQVVLFEDGENILIQSGKAGTNLLFISGKPLGEPISWRGPIVMNSKEEIDLAFRQLANDTFIQS